MLGVTDPPGLVDSSWASVAREQLLEDLALPGEDGGAIAGYGSNGAVEGDGSGGAAAGDGSGGVVPEQWQRRRGIGESENNSGK